MPGTIDTIREFLDLPKESLPQAYYADSDEPGDCWSQMRDYIRPVELQSQDHCGEVVILRAERDALESRSPSGDVMISNPCLICHQPRDGYRLSCADPVCVAAVEQMPYEELNAIREREAIAAWKQGIAEGGSGAYVHLRERE